MSKVAKFGKKMFEFDKKCEILQDIVKFGTDTLTFGKNKKICQLIFIHCKTLLIFPKMQTEFVLLLLFSNVTQEP